MTFLTVDEIPKPKLLPEGNYCPVQLLKFMKQCDSNNISDFQVARALRVELHRIQYFRGAGAKHLERRTKLAVITRGLNI